MCVFFLHRAQPFSLYYVVSNILMTVQSLLMKKICDLKMKAEVAMRCYHQEEQARDIKYHHQGADEKDQAGVVKRVSTNQRGMNKRAAWVYATWLDEERYKDERTVPLGGLEREQRRIDGC